jgi:hypothetical protein
MVAMVFMVVLVVALGFYFKFSMASVKETGENVCMVSNTVMLSSVATMPELQCSVNGKRDECVDTSKLLVFDTKSAVFNTNCEQKVYFEEIYPSLKSATCDLNNYPDCNIYIVHEPDVAYESSIKISTPVSLYYPLTNEYKFGKLVIEVLQ